MSVATRTVSDADVVFSTPPADPVALFAAWLSAAREAGARDPGALALATVDESGHPSNRTVQTVDVTATGFVFTTHAASRKGRDIASTGRASAVFYWRETSQQVVLTGRVHQLPDSRSDALWVARPPSTHPMSAVSVQSAPLDDEEALRREAAELAAREERLPRPDGWRGYELVPDSVEFWQGRPDRLHRRLRYDRTERGWRTQRLQP